MMNIVENILLTLDPRRWEGVSPHIRKPRREANRGRENGLEKGKTIITRWGTVVGYYLKMCYIYLCYGIFV